jgi:hypothetical protein
MRTKVPTGIFRPKGKEVTIWYRKLDNKELKNL